VSLARLGLANADEGVDVCNTCTALMKRRTGMKPFPESSEPSQTWLGKRR